MVFCCAVVEYRPVRREIDLSMDDVEIIQMKTMMIHFTSSLGLRSDIQI